MHISGYKASEQGALYAQLQSCYRQVNLFHKPSLIPCTPQSVLKPGWQQSMLALQESSLYGACRLQRMIRNPSSGPSDEKGRFESHLSAVASPRTRITPQTRILLAGRTRFYLD